MNKAYEFTFEDMDWNIDRGIVRTLVFAHTSGEDAVCDEMGCKRAKWADNLENASQLEIDVAELQHGWTFGDDEDIDKSTIPLVKKYGGIDKLISDYAKNANTRLRYGIDGFYELSPEDMPKNLKIAPEFMDPQLTRAKNFEIRKNDKHFKVGDELLLREWDGSKYTGRKLAVWVTYITNYKQLPGYVVLGTSDVPF